MPATDAQTGLHDMQGGLSASLKDEAMALGFELVGVASAADPLLAEAVERYSRWVSAGHGATMDYLARHIELKAHPEKLLAGFRSVVCVGLLYGAPTPEENSERAQVSLYARGQDYHELMTERLERLARVVRERHGAQARAFVDSQPVLERFWAWRAGLGWIGKNACLINRKQGSLLFLGGLLTDLELEPDGPQPDHCGRCTKCIDACPTGAIAEGRFIESAKCIAYHTIENRGRVPEAVMERMGRWVAGCDICQTVCPWNDPVTPGPSFDTLNPAFDAPLAELADWSAAEFKAKMKGVAMSRMKYAGFLRNVAIAIGNSGLSAEARAEALKKLGANAETLPTGEGRDAALEAVAWARKTRK